MRSVLITGGTGGLGSAVVARLARDYRCIVLYRSEDSWKRLHAEVPTAEGIASASEASRFAPLHAIVHLAGAFESGSDADAFRRMFDANVLSAAQAIGSALPHVASGGRIIAISSAASLSHPAGLSAYSASKAALNAFVQTLAIELAPRGITANALLPTALATPAMLKSAPQSGLVPLGRVAEWIEFLLSENGTGVTGQLIALT